MAAPIDDTETGMANRALALFGEPPISSLDDPKRAAARHCKRHFAAVRDGALREKPWQFARKYATPAAQTTPPPNPAYAYRYILPSDCLDVFQIGAGPVCPFGTDRPWEVSSAGDDATLGVVLDTSIVAPGVAYTRRMSNPAQWDEAFKQLFALRLAATVNPLIGRDKSLTAGFVNEADKLLDGSAMLDAQNRSRQHVRRDTSWVQARYGRGIPR